MPTTGAGIREECPSSSAKRALSLQTSLSGMAVTKTAGSEGLLGLRQMCVNGTQHHHGLHDFLAAFFFSDDQTPRNVSVVNVFMFVSRGTTHPTLKSQYQQPKSQWKAAQRNVAGIT